jgi:hypothetical protein
VPQRSFSHSSAALLPALTPIGAHLPPSSPDLSCGWYRLAVCTFHSPHRDITGPHIAVGGEGWCAAIRFSGSRVAQLRCTACST